MKGMCSFNSCFHQFSFIAFYYALRLHACIFTRLVCSMSSPKLTMVFFFFPLLFSGLGFLNWSFNKKTFDHLKSGVLLLHVLKLYWASLFVHKDYTPVSTASQFIPLVWKCLACYADVPCWNSTASSLACCDPNSVTKCIFTFPGYCTKPERRPLCGKRHTDRKMA